MLSSDRKIKVGLVGAGKIADNHIKAIQTLSDRYELAGLCDTHSETLEKAASILKIEGYPRTPADIEHASVLCFHLNGHG